MRIGVSIESDKVILTPATGSRDLLLGWRESERLILLLRMRAAGAKQNEPAGFKGEPWGVQVESYDGYVALRFSSPEPGPIRSVPIPWMMALRLADLIEFKAQQAAYKMRFEFVN